MVRTLFITTCFILGFTTAATAISLDGESIQKMSYNSSNGDLKIDIKPGMPVNKVLSAVSIIEKNSGERFDGEQIENGVFMFAGVPDNGDYILQCDECVTPPPDAKKHPL